MNEPVSVEPGTISVSLRDSTNHQQISLALRFSMRVAFCFHLGLKISTWRRL
jgi:hypothetical protein